MKIYVAAKYTIGGVDIHVAKSKIVLFDELRKYVESCWDDLSTDAKPPEDDEEAVIYYFNNHPSEDFDWMEVETDELD